MANVPPDYVGRVIRVSGIVQGVGFRPHIWRRASELGLSGHVLNDGQGVEINAWGVERAVNMFIETIACDAPPLSRVDDVSVQHLTDAPAHGPFKIAESQKGIVATGVVADAATCAACAEEIFDPANRRYGYAFTNCTHCGPRLSIVTGIPYDRSQTSMSAFTMCVDCQAEYDSAENRRFHAQPNACPACGPKLWLEDADGVLVCDDPLSKTAELIQEGLIVAIKGIGGFHLACDATNEHVVKELRRRKRRPDKPLALMVRDLEMLQKYAVLRSGEMDLLTSPAAPIVLLDAIVGNALSPAIAPAQDRIGFMLPYSPLHHLLMRQFDRPIVLTSGNLTDEPQVTDNMEARERLSPVADAWLTHDREIVNRLDDSVMRLDVSGPAVLRRARGLAPEPLRLHHAFLETPDVLAMGGELKSTFCLLQHGQAILSQHIGDLEDPAVHADYRKAMDFYRHAFDIAPSVIVVDQHPDYLSTQWGERLANDLSARTVRVQHHHAHMTACLAENLVSLDDDRAVGIILDGLGLGADGTIWGGEILVGGYRDFTRVGHFLPVALPGGALAMHEPWRNAVAHLLAAFGPDYQEIISKTDLGDFLGTKNLKIVHQAITAGINAPMASSAGRLFDAVAAVLGVCRSSQSYEGQAGVHLEALARPYIAQEGGYPVDALEGACRVLSWEPMWRAILADQKAGVETGRIAARFHQALITSIADFAMQTASAHGAQRAVLSGGVMQNQILSDGLFKRLTTCGLEVLTHRHVPANDGGLSVGQAVTASLNAPA